MISEFVLLVTNLSIKIETQEKLSTLNSSIIQLYSFILSHYQKYS